MTNKERALELMDLCLQIQSNSIDDIETSCNTHKPCLFFEFSGHVSILRVRIYPHGWYLGIEKSFEDFEFYLDKELIDSSLGEYEKCKKRLLNILKIWRNNARSNI